jgi:hypothetical protein
MTSGTPDNTKAGYITNEAVTLSVEPAASSYQWGIAKPQGASSRSDLSSTTDASPSFVPDTHGFWVLTCVVDGGTFYRLQLVVEAVAVTTHGDASRYIPVSNNTVPAPALGATLFYSRDDDRLSIKLPDGSVKGLVTT